MAKRKRSAGTLLYRHRPGADGDEPRLEVLLVHPSGAYNRRAPWSIPKGLPDADEQLEAAARRETLEETGLTAGALLDLGFIDYQKSRKRVFAFAGKAPHQNGVHIEPRCASWEVDRAEFLGLEEANERIHPDQRPFLERLAEHLDAGAVRMADLSQSDSDPT